MIRSATHLWFNGNAKEAVSFYVSLIPGSKILEDRVLADAGPNEDTDYQTLSFELAGTRYMALDKSPFTFTLATSIFLICDTQEEIDRLWEGFIGNGGKALQCGWLTDQYGLNWQIAPADILRMVCENSDAGRRAAKAMMSMIKFDIAALRAAYAGS